MKPYYEESGITIWHGDCREILPQLPASAVITDPPYGYNYASDYVCETTTAAWMKKEIANDSDLMVRDFVLSWAGNKPWAVFGSWKMPKPGNVRSVLVWDKGPASGMGDLAFPWKGSWEEIYVGGEGWSGRRDEGVIKDCWIVTRASMGRLHPNEKPVSLIKHIACKLPSDMPFIDPCMGSGSSLEAAKELGRSAIGIELEERYCEIAANRLRQSVFNFEEATA
jgi:site-specific DNA-methyltransferase (adenine-specific)